jgi:signal transduction histidine kinase/Tfp pilus assembly protein PilF
MKKLILIFVSFISLINFSYSEKYINIDSLQLLLKNKSLHDTIMIQILNKLSWEHRLTSFIKAEYYGKLALEKSKSINYTDGMLKSLSYLGVAYINEGNHPLALNHFYEALEIAKKIDNQVEISYTYNNLGKLYYNEKNVEKYSHYFEKALEAARKTDNKDALAYSLRNMALTYESQQRFNIALEYHLEALKIRELQNDSSYLIPALHLIGNCYSELGNDKKAFEMFDKALKIAADDNTILRKADILNAKAKAYQKIAKYDSAIICANQSFQIAKQQHAWEWIKISTEILYNIYQNKKDFDKALEYHVIWSSYKDSILNEGRIIKMNQIKMQYEFMQKEKELKAEQEKKEIIQQSKMEKQNLYLIISLVGLLLSIVVLVIISSLANKLHKTNEMLTLKSFEIEKQKNEITVTAKELNEANQVKSKLFSIIAHDLRSPFASLHSSMFLLEDNETTEEERQYIVSEIKKSVIVSLEMLDGLLLWAKSQMNNIQINLQVIDLKELIDNKISLFNEISKQKNVKLINEVTPNCMIITDINYLKLIFRNLISNALKFTKSGGTITIKAFEVEDDKIQVSVIDTGIGMSALNLQKLFRTESTFTTNGTSGEKGTGLGLLLCKEFVEKMGGFIWAESTIGVGTIFHFTLTKSQIVEEKSLANIIYN